MNRQMMVMSAALLALGASAATEVIDGVPWSYSVSDGKASVYKGSTSSPAIPAGTTGALMIPAALGGYPVTSIGSGAFWNCSGLTSVTIPSSVTSIGVSAFYNCSGLTSVTIPSSVTGIGASAFRGCSGLMSVAIPPSVTSIEFYAFNDCRGLTSMTIPLGVTSIGSGAFSDCSGLMSVAIPSSVTSIEDTAFCGCSGLTSFSVDSSNATYCLRNGLLCSKDGSTLIVGVNGNVTIPLGVTSIGSYAFYDYSGLTSVTIPSSVMIIGTAAFFGCSGLTSVTIPEGVTSIGSSAFCGCSGLMSMTIPLGVTSIESDAFYKCSGLMSVTIPSSVTSIGSSAFWGCSGLTSVTIPEGVTSIGSRAFSGCSGLKSVEFLGPPPSGFSKSDLLSYGTMSYPRECGAEWQKLIGLAEFRGYSQVEKPTVEIVSAAIRENDPTVMDVVYKVKSVKPMVKVRALAFQDGVRSFANVVKVTDLIEGTAANVGDAITANEEHKLSWRISSDWAIDLAKVKFEVLASEGDLLQLELTTIPKVGDHAAMEISWNAMTGQQVFDALLWLFADGDAGLTLGNGVLKNGTSQLVNKTTLSAANAIGYVYGKMGFSVLSGDELKYANEMTRLGLSPSGVRQYACRAIEE